jgi:hypothetical protein
MNYITPFVHLMCIYIPFIQELYYSCIEFGNELSDAMPFLMPYIMYNSMKYVPNCMHLIFIHIPIIRDFYYDYINRAYVYNTRELVRMKSWWNQYKTQIFQEISSERNSVSINALYITSRLTSQISGLHEAVEFFHNRLEHPIIMQQSVVVERSVVNILPPLIVSQ